VTVVGVHPPVAFTNLRNKQLVGGRWMKPFLKLSMKTPVQAAQTTIFAALDPSVVSGQIYRLDHLYSCSMTSIIHCQINLEIQTALMVLNAF